MNKNEDPRITVLRVWIFTFFAGTGFGIALSYWNTHLFVPTFLSQQHQDGLGECARNLRGLALALEAYRRDHGHLPENQNHLRPKYLRKFPNCPEAKRMTYRTSFGPRIGKNPNDNPDYYLVECSGDNHKKSWVALNAPQYDGIQGLTIR